MKRKILIDGIRSTSRCSLSRKARFAFRSMVFWFLVLFTGLAFGQEEQEKAEAAGVKIGLDFGAFTDFADFEPNFSLDLLCDKFDLTIGTQFSIYQEKVNKKTEDYTWLRFYFDFAPHIVKTTNCVFTLPIRVILTNRDYSTYYNTSSLKGSYINLSFGIRGYRNISEHLMLYAGLSDSIFVTNITDMKDSINATVYKQFGFIDWFSNGQMEVGVRCVF